MIKSKKIINPGNDKYGIKHKSLNIALRIELNSNLRKLPKLPRVSIKWDYMAETGQPGESGYTRRTVSNHV